MIDRAIIVHAQGVADWSSRLFLLPHDAKGSEVCEREHRNDNLDSEHRNKTLYQRMTIAQSFETMGIRNVYSNHRVPNKIRD